MVAAMVSHRARMAPIRNPRKTRRITWGWPDFVFFGLVRSATPNNGAKRTAMNQDAISAMPTTANNHLALLHDLSGFRASCCDRARCICLEFSEAQPVTGKLQLGFGVIDARLCGLQPFLRMIELGSARNPSLQQASLSFEIITRLGQLSLGSRKIGLSRTKAVLLVLRVQFGQQLPSLNSVTDVDQPFYHPARNSKA